MDKDEDSAQYLASSPKGYITMGKFGTIRESNQSRVYVRRITRSTKRDLGRMAIYFQGAGEHW